VQKECGGQFSFVFLESEDKESQEGNMVRAQNMLGGGNIIHSSLAGPGRKRQSDQIFFSLSFFHGSQEKVCACHIGMFARL
jgi:hypothetical protein